MNSETTNQHSEIGTLIENLCDNDGVTRMKAREELIEIGGMYVTRALIIQLNDPRRDVRWEAAKALVSIADPIAASALVLHLSDQDSDIRWLAAEGLSELGEPGLLATLNASIRHARDSEFCKAARHAFKEFQKHWVHPQLLDSVIDACEGPEPGVSLPVAAYQALQKVNIKQVLRDQPPEPVAIFNRGLKKSTPKSS